MHVYEKTTESFVVKVWLEEERTLFNRVMWRGHITHVTSGERHYVQNLDDILQFIANYLEPLGGDLGFCWRMRRLWKLLTRRMRQMFGLSRP